VRHIAYKPGNLAMVVGGEHSGEIGKNKTDPKGKRFRNEHGSIIQ
jgi:ribosomal protein S4E